MNVYAFTSTYDKISNVLQNEVVISQPNGFNIAEPEKKWMSLWDTGSTCTAITKKVVDELGLQPFKVVPAYTAEGTYYNANAYYIDLILFNNVKFPKLEVIEMLVKKDSPPLCDILIGMNIIGTGDFAISNYNGMTSFSFRYPSWGNIDFRENS